jgi:hypothetical protein
MSTNLRFVQGDTRPPLAVSIRTKTGDPVDVSDTLTTLVLKVRALGESVVKDTVSGTKVAGLLLEDNQTLDTSGAYAVPGAGGQVEFRWNPTTLDTAGSFEGEIEITFNDGTIQTVYDVVRFKVRPQF